MKPGRRGTAFAGDVRIVHERWGEGTPLVLCHAFGVDRTMWDGQVEAFAATHEVITFDQRGCGESDHPSPREGAPDPYTLDAFSEDLAAVLDDRGIARARILGESMGGGTALRFATRWPDRVEALILASTAVSRLPEKIVARALEVERIAQEHGLAEAVRFYFRGRCSRGYRAAPPGKRSSRNGPRRPRHTGSSAPTVPPWTARLSCTCSAGSRRPASSWSASETPSTWRTPRSSVAGFQVPGRW